MAQGEQLQQKEYDELVTHMLERAMAEELQAEGTSTLVMTDVEKRWLKSSYFSTFRLSAKRRE